MAKGRKTYLLDYSLIASGLLFALNLCVSFSNRIFADYVEVVFGLFLVPTLISTIIYLDKRTYKTFVASIIFCSVFLILNTIPVIEMVATEIQEVKFNSIEEQLETCEMAENQFKVDLEENDVKYFTFGMGEDEEFRISLEERFGLKVYHLGCSMTPPFDCYNKKVEQVLFESNSEKF